MRSIPIDVLLDRQERARRLMAELDLAALLLVSPGRNTGYGQSSGNTAYFLGYTTLGGATILLLPLEGRPLLLPGGPNERRMLEARVGDLADIREAGDPGPALREALRERGIAPGAPIGMAGRLDLPVRLAESLTRALGDLRMVDRQVHRLREVVAPADALLHRRASAISDLMLARAMAAAAEPGVTPSRLMAEVEYAGRSAGAEMARLWLAVGPNPPVTSFEFFELPERIAPGDRVQLGTTVCLEGHFTQGLRMGVLGEPSAELEAATATLLAIQDAALAEIAPGRPAHLVVDTLERLIVEHCPYTRRTDPFRFQSCHQLGLDYSDAALSEALNPGRDRSADADGPLLREGQVIEIHPNYNLPGLGHVCAGDAAMVTANGAEWITRYPRGLARLGAN